MTTHNLAAPYQKLPWPILFGNTMLFIYMLISIFHIFPSGLPQPSDFIIAIAIFVNGMAFMMQPQARFDQVFIYVVCFGFFTFLVNLVHYFFLPDLTFIKSSMYYLFNAGFFILVVSLLRAAPQQTWRVLYVGLVIAIILEIVSIRFLPSLRGVRETGTFANPNQLAVWALLASCMLVLLKARSRLNILDIALLVGLGFIQTVSLSKAGIISYLLLIAVLMFVPALTARARTFALFFAAVLAIYAMAESTQLASKIEQISNLEKVISRLETIGVERDDSLAGRGYTRIFENPEFLFFGAGEGGYLRFSNAAVGYELHSGLGTLVFCYGFLGLFLFLLLLGFVAHKNDALAIALLGIVFLYGLTHQNVRSADFWLFLAICYTYKDMDFSQLVPRRNFTWVRPAQALGFSRT